MPGSRTAVTVAAAVLAAAGCVAGKDPSSTQLNEWPMILAHDAATTYLDPEDPVHYVVYQWTITQPSKAGTSGLLDCGVRAFDWRPRVDAKTGSLVMHHGPITVDHPMSDAVQEVVDWSANRTAASDLVVFAVTDCDGDNCTGLVQELFDSKNITFLTNCGDLKMTVSEALEKSELAHGGHILAVNDCVDEHYDPSITCSGYYEREDEVGNSLRGGDPRTALHDDDVELKRIFNCWNTSKSHDIPYSAMWKYLNQVWSSCC